MQLFLQGNMTCTAVSSLVVLGAALRRRRCLIRLLLPSLVLSRQVLQIAEQILKSGDGLLDSGHAELPLDSQLGCFLDDLRKQLSTDPSPGEVLRQVGAVALPLHHTGGFWLRTSTALIAYGSITSVVKHLEVCQCVSCMPVGRCSFPPLQGRHWPLPAFSSCSDILACPSRAGSACPTCWGSRASARRATWAGPARGSP